MIDEAYDYAYKAFSRRRPFKPYLVELVSGDRIRVSHPEAHGNRGILLFFLGTDGKYQLFDRSTVAQMLDVKD